MSNVLPAGGGDVFSCDFDSQDFCGMTFDPDAGKRDMYKFLLQTGSTASGGTGPDDDQEGGGAYVYFETSDPVKNNKGTARYAIITYEVFSIYQLSLW